MAALPQEHKDTMVHQVNICGRKQSFRSDSGSAAISYSGEFNVKRMN
jgi:hypothetical protein